MPVAYHHVAYADLEVCNPTTLDAVVAMAGRTGLGHGALGIDIGAGAGGVSVVLADRFGMSMAAIERDPVMAETIRGRVAAAGLADRVTVLSEGSETALVRTAPADLIVALGAIDAAAPGLREPTAIFASLAAHLKAPGWLLWGDLYWKSEPPEPLRQIISLSGDYATDAGWREAGVAAGYDLVAAELAPEEDWERFFGHADAAARAWLDANPDHPDAPRVRFRADQVKATFDFGRPYLGFGLYLFRKG